MIGSGDCGRVKSLIAGVLFSHAFSGELKAMSIMNEAVQDGVAEGGITYDRQWWCGRAGWARGRGSRSSDPCGELEARCQALGVALGGFAIDKKSDAFLGRETMPNAKADVFDYIERFYNADTGTRLSAT